jgi:hypothetical protein
VSETHLGRATRRNLPVFELLDIIYGLLEAGAVVEQDTGSFKVLVVGDQLVVAGGRVGPDGGHLLLPGKGGHPRVRS